MTGTSRWLGLVALAFVVLAAPAGAGEEARPAADDASEPSLQVDDASEPSLQVDGASDAFVDPPPDAGADDAWLDGANRASREFNFWMFDHVLEPASRGYNYVMPKWGQQRIQNFFENLERPRDVINSLLQGKGRRAGNHLAAFLVNTTAGLAGLFVISDHFIAIEPPETTNETLGVYGIPPGPYLVIPLYGESCPRCLLGSLGDTAMYPIFWIPGQAGMYAGIGARGLNAVNLVAKQMPSPFADDSEWDAYHERLHDRHAYEEAKRLFFENQALDVED